MKKIHVPHKEKSRLAKELITEINEEIFSFSDQITFQAPTENYPQEYWKEVHDELVLPAIETYNETDKKIESSFEKQMQELVIQSTQAAPRDKDNHFGISLGKNGYVIKYNDGSELLTKDEIKSEWESGFFNYLSKNGRHENFYNSLGKKLKELGPKSELSIEKETGNLYIFEKLKEGN